METKARKTIRWTDEEWDKCAIALHLEHPELRLHEVDNFRMGVGPFMAVMRKTLPEDRWRVFHIPNDFKKMIIPRIKALRPILMKHTEESANDIPARKATIVEPVQAAPEIIPNEVPPTEPIIPEHTPPAEPLIPDELPTPAPVIPNEPPPLNPVLSAEILNMFKQPQQPEVEETSAEHQPQPEPPPEEPPVEAPPPEVEPNIEPPPEIKEPDAPSPGMAFAVQQLQTEVKPRELGGFRATKEGKHRAGRIFWTDDEWLAITRELYRRSPQIIHSSTLISIKNPDIVAAQTVLPTNRHRLSQIPMDSARDKIKEALKVVKDELVQQEEEKRKQEEEAKAAAYAQEQLAKEAARNPFEVAMEPLMKLMKEQILLAIEPMLQEILNRVRDATHIKEEIVVDFHTPRKPPEPRKPLIGICGIQPQNARRVTDQFPQYDFLITGEDVTNILSVTRSCDKVLAMKWINHPDVWKLKKQLGDKFVIINGGASEMKRVLGIMETSGSLAAAAYSKN